MTVLMRPSIVFLLCCLAVGALFVSTCSSALTDAQEVPDEEQMLKHVQVISSTNFASKLASGPLLVKFFAPWCSHCKDLRPIFAKVAYYEDRRDDDNVNLGAVDCIDSDNRMLCKRFSVRAFPTLILFKDGKMYEYSGPRTFQSIEDFIHTGYKTTAPASIPEAPSEIGEWIDYLRWQISRNAWLSVGIVAAVALVLGFLNGVAVGYWMGSSDRRALNAEEAQGASAATATSTKPSKDSSKSKSKAE
eukprot:CAMPEP_0177663950 /NCGR_PEP_ID=MMETSP0447-20121125/20205_1 /TAXON_ID=0 /ORGANISM="Stygamoeba regulata, Strain BSH-02190019" /LENGTH=246 /DNA_ID=CAMNT_0019169833 /DNA_START=28 /DNA_END=768 /DNA_ORIENTATION=-